MRFHRPRPLAGRPTVSVVIPSYNYGRFLPDAVAAALDQELVDVEVIIVDDASTDDSATVAARLAEHPQVQLLRHEVNRGHIATYNDGLAVAFGDYVTLVSADDLVARNALTRAVALMETHPDVGLVYGYARSFSGTPDVDEPRVRSWSVYSGAQWLSVSARRGRCFIVSPEAVMRRDAWLAAGPYDDRLPHSADFALWLATAAGFGVGRVNGPVQAHYRVHEQNMHLTAYAGWLTDLEERRRTFDLFFEGPGAGRRDTDELRAAARRALAREALRRGAAAVRDGDPEAARYLDFARRVDREVCAGARGRLARRVEARGVGERTTSTWRFVEKVDHHLRWRRERRYGS